MQQLMVSYLLAARDHLHLYRNGDLGALYLRNSAVRERGVVGPGPEVYVSYGHSR